MRPGKIKYSTQLSNYSSSNFQAPLDAQNRDRRTFPLACFGRELDGKLHWLFGLPSLHEFHCFMGDDTRILTESHLDPCSPCSDCEP